MSYRPGTLIQLTGRFLRYTGQIVGGEGEGRWLVQECGCPMCMTGDFVCTNEPKSDLTGYTMEELDAEPALRWRHMRVSNVCAVGEVTTRNCP